MGELTPSHGWCQMRPNPHVGWFNFLYLPYFPCFVHIPLCSKTQRVRLPIQPRPKLSRVKSQWIIWLHPMGSNDRKTTGFSCLNRHFSKFHRFSVFKSPFCSLISTGCRGRLYRFVPPGKCALRGARAIAEEDGTRGLAERGILGEVEDYTITTIHLLYK